MQSHPVPHHTQRPGPPGRIDIINCTKRFPSLDCWIDGDEIFKDAARGGWAQVAPGRHEITCEAAWRGGFGKVTQVHDIRPGENIVLYYSPPMTLFSKGALARVQQPRRWAPHWPYIGTSLLLAAAFFAVCFVLYLLFGP